MKRYEIFIQLYKKKKSPHEKINFLRFPRSNRNLNFHSFTEVLISPELPEKNEFSRK